MISKPAKIGLYTLLAASLLLIVFIVYDRLTCTLCEIGPQQSAKIQLMNLEMALGQYHKEHGSYPSTEQGLAALVDRYLKSLPKDPWGRNFLYRHPGDSGNAYDLISLGEDGEAGGQDEDADISLWCIGK